MAIIKLITRDADEGVRKGDACHLLLVMCIRSPEPDQYGGTSKTQNYHITSGYIPKDHCNITLSRAAM